MSNVTPFVKRMRAAGGTIYVFSSATEDIGLNISERNNAVKISNYALLNIPSIAAPDNINQNKFNVLGIPGAFESFLDSNSIKDGRVLIAESFQNYALNLETNLLQQSTYNSLLPATVSERVFWKWLKESGAIRWEKLDTSTGTYWKEEIDTNNSLQYNSVVKGIGEITAGAVRYDTFGTYNETYVMIPTSYGQSNVYFKQIEDTNYKHGMVLSDGGENIMGRENYTSPHPDALDFKAYYDMTDSSTTIDTYSLKYDASTGSWSSGWWMTGEGIAFNNYSYCTDRNDYLTSGILNTDLQYDGGTSKITYRRSNVDCLSIVYDINALQDIYGDQTLTYDKMAIEDAINDNFDFNAILIYYSVYNKNLDTLLSRNLLGVLFLDSPAGNTSGFPANEITIPSITKMQSNSSGFGTSYSFRLNIKTDNMFDDTTSVIYDESTSTSTILSDFSEVFDALGKSVDILNKHTSTISYITDQYNVMESNQSSILNSIVSLQHSINGISRDITGSESAIAMFSSGSNPLIDSSIYMWNGNVGVKTNRPAYDFQVNGSIGADNVFVKESIKDFNGNILLGSGSYLNNAPFLQESSIGSGFSWSAGMLIANGGSSTADIARIDASIVRIDGSLNNLFFYKASTTYVNNAVSSYLPCVSIGSGLVWNGVYLDVSIQVNDPSDYISQSYFDISVGAKANISSPIFTGDPQRSTDVSLATNSNVFATTKFVHDTVDGSLLWLQNNMAIASYIDASLATKADISSPIFTGIPQYLYDISVGDDSSTLATTRFVNASVISGRSYTDASLLIRDASITSALTLINDLSTNYYNEFNESSVFTIPSNSYVNIPVGLRYLDRSIILTYTSSRYNIFREGEIRLLNDGSTMYSSEIYQENSTNPHNNLSGMSIDASFNVSDPSVIVLKVLVDASTMNSVSFKFTKRNIKI